MADIASLGFSIDTSEIEPAIATLNRLAEASERAKRAVDSLNGGPHDGIDIQIVGSVAKVSFKGLPMPDPKLPSALEESVARHLAGDDVFWGNYVHEARRRLAR